MSDDEKRTLEGLGLKLANYKSFGPEHEGFDEIKKFNLIVGRNNSGKSTLLDMVEDSAIRRQNKWKEKSKLRRGSVQLYEKPSNNQWQEVLKGNSDLHSELAQHQGRLTIVRDIRRQTLSNEFSSVTEIVGAGTNLPKFLNETQTREQIQSIFPSFLGRTIRSVCHRIAPDRNLWPEPYDSSFATDVLPRDQQVGPNGAGYTGLFHSAIHRSATDPDLVRSKVLDSLNYILQPDDAFVEIAVRSLENETNWQIELRLQDKTFVPIQEMGHGVRTILMALATLLLLPFGGVAPRPDPAAIYLFEELENNLHPAVFRRLIRYLLDYSQGSDAGIFFITTHSSVAIDLVLNAPVITSAQVVHVTRTISSSDSGTSAYSKCTPVQNSDGIRTALDDLGVRGSDLMQANGIVWVEGPSDRIYLKKWIELESGGALRENEHYSFACYGGRTLANYGVQEDTILDNDVVDDLIRLMPINRNGFLVMDSDYKKTTDRLINTTKMRLFEEASMANWDVWVTEGKEIENYLPHELVVSVFGVARTKLGQFKDVPKSVNSVKGKASLPKVKMAKLLMDSEEMRKELFDNAPLHLAEKVTELCATIRRWNGMET
jgi:energy-coupling factor transporter ATP-binding protein EcfA2